jgi:hypothetical protein
LVRAANGTLAVSGSVIDGQPGTIQIDAGATLDLSGAAGNSDGDFLIHNGTATGSLNLGANSLLVGEDYNNANFGVGNAFNHRANVTGAGQILADAAFTISASGNVTGGTTIDFGNRRVGAVVNLSYQVNHGGMVGASPQVRTAIQTAAGGGSISDARLSGAGVTASNLTPIAAGDNSGPLAVTFTANSAGALTGQSVHIEDNFDNVNGLTLGVIGAAYNPAVATVTPTTVDFGIVHVGDAVGPRAIQISNEAAAGAFSEDLLVNNFVASGNAVIAGGGPSSVAVAAQSASSSLAVSVDTATAGAKSGTVTLRLTSTGVVGGAAVAGLAPLDLGSAAIQISAQVNNFAAPELNKTSGQGALIEHSETSYSVDFGTVPAGSHDPQATLEFLNEALAPADDLAGNWMVTADPVFTFSGFDPFSDLDAGEALANLKINLDTSTVGTFSGRILLNPRSENASGFSGTLPQVAIHITGNVTIPEPAGCTLALVGLVTLSFRHRVSRRQ